jgi:hypothetical protein
VSARKTLLFAVIAIVFGAYIYLVERPRMAAEGEEDRLVELDVESVRSLRLSYPDGDPIAVERDGEDWRMTEPMRTAADGQAIVRLLEQIADAKAERRIAGEEAQELSTYGLDGDGERARVSIELEGGTALDDIIVGGTTPVGYNAFARVEGSSDIVVTPLIFHTGVKKSVFEMRDKQLFDFDEGAVTAIDIESPDGHTRLQRDGDGWRLLEPLEDHADGNQVKTLLSSLTNLQALAFFEADEHDAADIGLTPPRLEVTLELDGDDAPGFRLGEKTSDGPAGNYFERLPDGQRAKVPDWVATRFGQDTNALRDKHLFDCDPNEIARMAFERDDGHSFALVEADDGGWSIEPPADGTIKRGVVTRRRTALATLAGTAIVADDVEGPEGLAAYGLDRPVLEVELGLRDGTLCGSAAAGITGADSDAPAYYVKRSNDDTVMSIAQHLFSRLDALPEDFLE